MGILNNKQRILDSLITLEGRRQINGGQLKIKFAAFSDKHTFYEGSIASGSTDASERVFFEAVSLPQDQITFEADDSGRLLSFDGRSFTKIVDGKPVISGSFLTDSSQFASTANTLLTGSVLNFKDLRIIGSQDLFIDDNEFLINPKEITFALSDENPIRSNSIQSISVNQADSFFQDRRLSHIKNFQYLPPRNKSTITDTRGASLGNYQKLSQQPILTLNELMDTLKNKEEQVVHFSETSRMNNVFCQFFEVSANDMKKLDVIDFGTFPSEGEDVHVFFAGKIFVDDLQRATFINLFTIIFE